MSLYLYNFFHLNLAYSAIEEEDRPEVIEKCYWPLLRLARKRNLPFGIELSGYTLEVIQELDPRWVEEFKGLINGGACELIGCGYAQVIGPLVPHEVTSANLRIGHAVYEEILGLRPRIALLNEQAYSSGLVPLYKAAGYEAIIMEWNNPAREHPEWDDEWRYLPQRAKGTGDSEIGLIWNKSIGFQKFQRYAHGELELNELLDYIRSHKSERFRAFPVYGNDVEIFDYRPGRYMTEATIHDEGEWLRIDRLYEALQQELDMKFIKTSEVMDLRDVTGANNLLELSSAAQPIPVKKQEKYNVVRWALTGRDDLGINTSCWRLYEALKGDPSTMESDWKELCYLWSSDFRTHITERRWNSYLKRLSSHSRNWSSSSQNLIKKRSDKACNKRYSCHSDGKYIFISGERIRVVLNGYRGLALHLFTDISIFNAPLCGTIGHGFYEDIKWSSDYYSGHIVLESLGMPKITDLNVIEPKIEQKYDQIFVSAEIQTNLGVLKKMWIIDDDEGEVRLIYNFMWSEPILGSLRLGYVTLFTDSFQSSSFSFSTHNGGSDMESFLLDRDVDHGRPVSFLVSSNQMLSATGGIVYLGDNQKKIVVKFKNSQHSIGCFVQNQKIGRKNLCRLFFSAMEIDDTRKPFRVPVEPIEIVIRASGL